MNTLLKIGFCLLQLYWGTNTLAQKVSIHKKAQSAYENAAKYLSQQDKENAIIELKSAIELDPTFATAYQQLADLYRNEKKYHKAIPLYKKVIQIDPYLTKLTYFGLGESQLGTGDYQSALDNLKKYTEIKSGSKSNEKLKKYILDCEFSLRQSADQSVHIKKLSAAINSVDNEYFPKLTADANRIIFTRKTNNQENFFESTKEEQVWSVAQKLSGSVNSELFNEGAHSISPDGKYLFFTGCNRPNGMGSCDIYVSKFENGTWSAPYNLGAPINTKGWEAQPAISADGRTLYFVSNRPGGLGGSDIWKSQLAADGKWQTPENLGSNVNSIFDERAPYIHADNKSLYFASEGWPGFGQFDLFKTQVDTLGQWSIPTNMGSPINNNYDQTAIHLTMNGATGFLSSADSSGQLDIYSLNIPKPIQPTAVAYIQGTVYDSENKNKLSATISVTNTHNKELVYLNESDYYDGQFIATLPVGSNYAVHFQKPGYLFESRQYNISNMELKDEVFKSDILLQPIKTGIVMQLNNIYFGSDSAIPLKSSDTELQLLVTFLKTNPTIAIEVAGHTDDTGNKAHNQTLSEHRAAAISTYLLSKGIPKSKVISRGYGDSKPIDNNATKEGKQRNRRTEIILR